MIDYFFFKVRTDDVALQGAFLELRPEESIFELIEDFYQSAGANERTQAQFLVVRPPVRLSYGEQESGKFRIHHEAGDPRDDKYSAFKYEREDAQVLERFCDYPIYVLYSDGSRIRLSHNINTSCADDHIRASIQADSMISALRRAELNHLIRVGRAIFPQSNSALYEAPSGNLTAAFLRVGNIQRSRYALDALFFWMLPVLRETEALIADNWSIGSLILNVSRRLVTYENLGNYPVDVPKEIRLFWLSTGRTPTTGLRSAGRLHWRFRPMRC